MSGLEATTRDCITERNIQTSDVPASLKHARQSDVVDAVAIRYVQVSHAPQILHALGERFARYAQAAQDELFDVGAIVADYVEAIGAVLGHFGR